MNIVGNMNQVDLRKLVKKVNPDPFLTAMTQQNDSCNWISLNHNEEIRYHVIQDLNNKINPLSINELVRILKKNKKNYVLGIYGIGYDLIQKPYDEKQINLIKLRSIRSIMDYI